eukprot:3834352-Amphidinium_carterae.1
MSDWSAVAAPQASSASAGDDVSTGVVAFSLSKSNSVAGKRRGRPSQLKQVLAESFPHIVAQQHGGQIVQASAGVRALPARVAVERVRVADDCSREWPLVKRGRIACDQRLMQPLLAAADRAMNCEPSELDALVGQLGSFYFNTEEFHLGSWGYDAKIVQMLHALSRSLVHSFSSDARLWCMEFATYDETPLKVSLKDVAPVMPSLEMSDDHESVDVAHAKVVKGVSSQAVIAKILQSHSAVSYMLKTVTGLIAFTMNLVLPLQSMQRTTGQVLQNCLARTSCLSMEAEQFGVKVRSVSCDAAGYNDKAEALLQAARSSWHTNIFHCSIHGIAEIHSKSFEGLFPECVTGMLRTALALRMQHTFASFRRAVVDVLTCMPLKIIDAIIPEDVVSYKLQMLAIYFQHSHAGLDIAVALCMAFNGNWQNTNSLEFYWNSKLGPCPGESVIKRNMISTALSCLLKKKPSVWPRHRWTGFRASLRDLGLFFCIHHIMDACFKRFLHLLQHANTKPVVSHGHVALDNVCGNPLMLEGGGGDMSGPDPGGVPIGLANIEAVNPGADDGDGSGGFTAAANAKDRQVATEWLGSNPWQYVLLISIALQPLDDLLCKHFELSSWDYEKQQRCQAMKDILEGTTPSRQYRLSIAADMDFEKDFYVQLEGLYYDKKTWLLIPEVAHHFHFRAACFKLLSRLGCCVEAALCSNHRKWPYKLWKLLRHPELVDELAAEPSCIKDSYSKAIQDKFGGFSSELVLAALRLHAAEQKVDNNKVEALNASIRRHVKLGSCQTWTIALKQLSAQWMIQCMRTNCRKDVSSKKRKWVMKKVKAGKARKKHVGGGSWRAFIRQATLGMVGRPNIQAIAHQYWEAKQNEFAGVLERDGARATLLAKLRRSKLGRKCVVKTSKQLRLQRQMLLSQSFYSDHKTVQVDKLVTSIVDRHGAHSLDVDSARALARACMREASKELANAAKQVDATMELYKERVGNNKVKLVKEQVPGLSHVPLLCVPHAGFNAFEVQTDSVKEQALQAVAWMSGNQSCNLGPALDAIWEHGHHTVQETTLDCNTFGEAGAATAADCANDGACFGAGICLCSESGKKLHRLKNKFLRAFKDTFHTIEQKLLVDKAGVVVCFTNTSLVDAVTWADHGYTTNYYYHIGHISWSPYRLTLHEVHECLAADELSSDHHVYVQVNRPLSSCLVYHEATNTYWSEYQALQRLGLDFTWQVSFFTLVETLTPIAALEPHTIAITKHPGPSSQLWPITRTRAGHGGLAVAPLVGWGAVAAGRSLPLAHDIEMAEDAHVEVDEAVENLPEMPTDISLGGVDDVSTRALAECLEGAFPELAPEPLPMLHEVPMSDVGDSDPDVAIPEPEFVPVAIGRRQEDEVIVDPLVTGRASGSTTMLLVTGPKLPAEAQILWGGGRIAFHVSKDAFECTCANPAHNFGGRKCVLTRTCKSKKSDASGRPLGGRPLGFLMAWLKASHTGTREDHWNKSKWKLWTPAYRLECRNELAALPGGTELLSLERERAGEEPVEPTGLIGLLT